MGRKRYKANFIDMRGRWIDNDKLIQKILLYAANKKDWTELLEPLLCEDSAMEVGTFKQYKYPPDLRMAKLDDYDLSGITLNNANLSKATMYRSEADSVRFKDVRAIDTRWRDSSLKNSVFTNVDFHHSNFSHVDLSNAEFSNCNLRHCYFRNSILKGVRFTNTDLRHSNLSEADIDLSTFDSVKLYGSSLWGIKYRKINAVNIDLSFSGDGSVTTDDIRIAPLLHLLEDRKLSEIINSLKSNTVVILGCDSDNQSKRVLENIGLRAKKWGFTPIIIRNINDIDGEGFTKKAVMYSLLAKFVIIENSRPSGHILEFSKVLDLGCIVGVLQKVNTRSTWLLEEYFIRYQNSLGRHLYADDIDEQIDKTYEWCNNQQKRLANQLNEIYKGYNQKQS